MVFFLRCFICLDVGLGGGGGGNIVMYRGILTQNALPAFYECDKRFLILEDPTPLIFHNNTTLF